jgi:hypothetical protein
MVRLLCHVFRAIYQAVDLPRPWSAAKHTPVSPARPGFRCPRRGSASRCGRDVLSPSRCQRIPGGHGSRLSPARGRRIATDPRTDSQPSFQPSQPVPPKRHHVEHPLAGVSSDSQACSRAENPGRSPSHECRLYRLAYCASALEVARRKSGCAKYSCEVVYRYP